MPSQAQNSSREMILPAYKAAISPGPPTPHQSPLTIYRLPFNQNMQNKPNFPKAKINATSLYTKGYENELAFSFRENKPNLSRRSPLAAAKYSAKPGWRSRNEPNSRSEQMKYSRGPEGPPCILDSPGPGQVEARHGGKREKGCECYCSQPLILKLQAPATLGSAGFKPVQGEEGKIAEVYFAGVIQVGAATSGQA
jgi:hypothetical protein